MPSLTTDASEPVAIASTSSSARSTPLAATRHAQPDAWLWDAALGAYYQAASDTYALALPSGEWTYASAADLRARHTERDRAAPHLEDGEIEDDVGWGGLMSPSELARASRLPAGAARHSSPTADNADADADTAAAAPRVDTDQVLRLVVRHSTVLAPGHVALVDSREGGVQVGRDRCERGGPARIRIKEMEVSKTHAVVYWGVGERDGDEQWGWWIVDLGSTTGTFLTPPHKAARVRLSEAKHSSLPRALAHLSLLTFGQTELEVHLHDSWPCEACRLADNEIVLDDGAVPVDDKGKGADDIGIRVDAADLVLDPHGRKTVRDMKRKRAMDALKETLLGGDAAAPSPSPEPNRYVDRSAQRRRLHPVSPPRERPRTPDVVPITPTASQGPSAAARSMLAGQGWTPGTTLGKSATGLTTALDPQRRTERRGLGAKGSLAPPSGGDWMDKAKQRRWEDAQQP
ncbi:hypothetical protein Q5752_000777 [Cryptotrichosporon argae]